MLFLREFISKVEKLLGEDLLNYTQDDIPIIFYLDLSVLAGEFYSTTYHVTFYAEIKDELLKLEMILKRLELKVKFLEVISQRQDPDPDNKNVALAKIKKLKELLLFFKKVRQLYLKLIYKAERDFTEYGQIIDLYNTNEIFETDLIQELYSHKYEEFRDSEDFEYDIFQINVKLSEIDMDLDCDESTIRTLIAYRNFLDKHKGLSNENSNLVIRILLDKSKFLLYKIYLRRFKQSTNNKTENSFYTAQIDEISSEAEFYLPFILSSHRHYSNGESKLTKDLKLKLGSPTSIFLMSEIHLINKYFRQLNSQKALSNFLSTNTDISKINYPEFSYNEFAKASALNLLKNTSLRLRLEEEEKGNFKEVVKLLKEKNVEKFNTKYLDIINNDASAMDNYRDYYPYTLLFQFFGNLLDYLIEKPFILLSDSKSAQLEEGKNIEKDIAALFSKEGPFGILLDYFETLCSRFIPSLKLCDHKKYKPIYLTYKECKSDVPSDYIKKIVSNKVIDNLKIELFVESSYILPDDYDKINEQWKDVNFKFKEKIRIVKNALTTEGQLRFYEKSFKKEVENKEFKLVQALAMFIAIATLVIGAFKATEGRSVLSSIIIIVGLAGALMLFNYFIYWFIRADKSIKIREILILLAIGGLFTWVYFTASNNDDNLKTLKYKSDSLNLYRTSYDSLVNIFQKELLTKDQDSISDKQRASLLSYRYKDSLRKANEALRLQNDSLRNSSPPAKDSNP